MKKYKNIIHKLLIFSVLLFGIITQDFLATLKIGLIVTIILLFDDTPMDNYNTN